MKTNRNWPEVEHVTPDSGPPWTVRRMAMAGATRLTHVIARDGFTIIATVHGGHGSMFAAAPDMLEALREAERILWMAEAYAEGGGSGGPEMRDYTPAAEAIRAAIAKASP